MAEKKTKRSREDTYQDVMVAMEIFMVKGFNVSPPPSDQELAKLLLMRRKAGENPAKDTFRCFRLLTRGEFYPLSLSGYLIKILLDTLYEHNEIPALKNVFRGLDASFDKQKRSYVSARKIVAEYKQKFKELGVLN